MMEITSLTTADQSKDTLCFDSQQILTQHIVNRSLMFMDMTVSAFKWYHFVSGIAIVKSFVKFFTYVFEVPRWKPIVFTNRTNNVYVYFKIYLNAYKNHLLTLLVHQSVGQDAYTFVIACTNWIFKQSTDQVKISFINF